MIAINEQFDASDVVSHLLIWWDSQRATLPWRETKDPYAIWIAEVMLQQTQIQTVIPYYKRWMNRFPSVEALAEAPLDEVLKSWEGLGYYSRARSLHESARLMMEELKGELPTSRKELMRLKGIGPYTAAAIASIAFGERVAAVDGNVTRVITRMVDLAQPISDRQVQKQIWKIADSMVPDDRPGDFNQALMELGQAICLTSRPLCHLCPIANNCDAWSRGTQLERPVRPPRKRIPHYNVTAGIIRNAKGRILISKRPLDGLLGGLWEFPGGKQEEGETLEEALGREIQEELGIEIAVGKHLTSIKHAYTHFRITLHVFKASLISGEPRNIGVIDHRWVTSGELNQYAFAATDRKIIGKLLENGLDNQLVGN